MKNNLTFNGIVIDFTKATKESNPLPYWEVEGDLIELAQDGKFDVIAHGVNCQCVQGAGLAPQMVKAFGTDKFKLEDPSLKGDINKLGQIDFKDFHRGGDGFTIEYQVLYVVNAYTQFNYGRNHSDGDEIPFDYEAFTLCMRKMNKVFSGKHIGLPQIGAGLAGGDWEKIETIIRKELSDCRVTVVIYNK